MSAYLSLTEARDLSGCPRWMIRRLIRTRWIRGWLNTNGRTGGVHRDDLSTLERAATWQWVRRKSRRSLRYCPSRGKVCGSFQGAEDTD